MLAFVLISFGLVAIFTKSSLFEPLRAFVEHRSHWWWHLIGCTMCNGFWVGVALALVGLWPHVSSVRVLDVLAAGWTSAGVSWALHRSEEHTSELQSRQ